MTLLEHHYINPATFTGDNKAFFAKLVTLGWVARMRLRANGHPLEKSYSGSMRDARKIVPLMYQLTERPLVDLVEAYLHGPALYDEAARLMSVSCIKRSADDFRLMLPDFGPEMTTDYITVSKWFEDRGVLFEEEGKALQNDFLHSEEWTFRMGWFRCSLEFRSLHSVQDGITRVLSNQLAGSWSPLGYVRRAAERMCPDEEQRVTRDSTMIVPASPLPGPLEREACVCPRAIELSSALYAFAPVNKADDSLFGKQMTRLRRIVGLNSYELYQRFVALLEEFVYWHECGHIHYDAMELDLSSSLVSNSYYYQRYGYDYSELAAESFAIERCIDDASHEVRMMLLTTFLSEDTNLKEVSLCELIKIRSLSESIPSAYIKEFLFLSIAKLRLASTEIEKRVNRDGVGRGDLMWSSHVGVEIEKGDSFTEWQAEVEKRLRKEVAEQIIN